MASIYRRARSPFYWVKFRDHEGRVARVSTKSQDPDEARELATELEEVVKVARSARGAMKAGAMARLVELGYLASDALLPTKPEPEQDETGRLDVLADLSPMAQGEKRNRPGDYKTHMARLREFMEATGVTHIDQLTPAHARGWIDRLIANGNTTEQIRHRLRYLRAAANTAPEHGHANPLGLIRIPRNAAAPKKIVTLSLAELRKLLGPPSGLMLRHRIAVGLMGAMGLRLSEVCRLQWADLRNDVLHVGARDRKTVASERMLPVPSPLLSLLEEHRAERIASLSKRGLRSSDMSPAILARRHSLDIAALDIRRMSRSMTAAIATALPGTAATATSLRKSFATVATWDLGIPPEVVEAFLGRRVSGLGSVTNRHYLGRAAVERLRPHAQAIGEALWGTRAGHTRDKSSNASATGRPSKP